MQLCVDIEYVTPVLANELLNAMYNSQQQQQQNTSLIQRCFMPEDKLTQLLSTQWKKIPNLHALCQNYLTSSNP